MQRAVMTITNSIGQLVLQEKINNSSSHTFDISAQPSGIYLIELNNDGAISRTKLLKK